jgi:gas vesicle protein
MKMLFIGLFIGAIVGYATACLMFVAGRADKEIIKIKLNDLD